MFGPEQGAEENVWTWTGCWGECLDLKREEVAGGWRTLHNDVVYNLYWSPNIIRIIRSERMRHAARMGSWQMRTVLRSDNLKWGGGHLEDLSVNGSALVSGSGHGPEAGSLKAVMNLRVLQRAATINDSRRTNSPPWNYSTTSILRTMGGRAVRIWR
jgi:hypothetical protein